MKLYHYSKQPYVSLQTVRFREKLSDEQIKEGIRSAQFRHEPAPYYDQVSFLFDPLPLDIIGRLFAPYHNHTWVPGQVLYEHIVESSSIGHFLFKIGETKDDREFMEKYWVDDDSKKEQFFSRRADQRRAQGLIGEGNAAFERVGRIFVGKTRQAFIDSIKVNDAETLSSHYAADVPHAMIYPKRGEIHLIHPPTKVIIPKTKVDTALEEYRNAQRGLDMSEENTLPNLSLEASQTASQRWSKQTDANFVRPRFMGRVFSQEEYDAGLEGEESILVDPEITIADLGDTHTVEFSLEAKKKKWSKSVTKKDKWHAPAGFFTKPAEDIAKSLKRASDSKAQAMSRLNFYINRAGKNLSDKEKAKLNHAKEILHELYGDDKKLSKEEFSPGLTGQVQVDGEANAEPDIDFAEIGEVDQEIGVTTQFALEGKDKEKWSDPVTKNEKWHPPKDFFKQSSAKIAKGLKEASSSEKQAMSRLNFYINRAGKNLSEADKKRLEDAKVKLKKLYEKE